MADDLEAYRVAVRQSNLLHYAAKASELSPVEMIAAYCKSNCREMFVSARDQGADLLSMHIDGLTARHIAALRNNGAALMALDSLKVRSVRDEWGMLAEEYTELRENAGLLYIKLKGFRNAVLTLRSEWNSDMARSNFANAMPPVVRGHQAGSIGMENPFVRSGHLAKVLHLLGEADSAVGYAGIHGERVCGKVLEALGNARFGGLQNLVHCKGLPREFQLGVGKVVEAILDANESAFAASIADTKAHGTARSTDEVTAAQAIAGYCSSGCVKMFRLAVASGFDLKDLGIDGLTARHWAVLSRNDAAVQALDMLQVPVTPDDWGLLPDRYRMEGVNAAKLVNSLRKVRDGIRRLQELVPAVERNQTASAFLQLSQKHVIEPPAKDNPMVKSGVYRTAYMVFWDARMAEQEAGPNKPHVCRVMAQQMAAARLEPFAKQMGCK
ncbi:MAG: hypothetical protein FJX77_12400 [Armatimonadetes bacterium]|nr:hypothetical protein [Armatimonadota bacterium]